MNLALEKITGKRISATEGKTHRLYKCPECLAPVVFVDPGVQVAHFRHLPHAAKKDCPLYPVAYGYDISHIFHHRAFRQKQPKLFVRLSGDGLDKQWELVLLVPRIDNYGEFVVDKSPNRGRISMRGVTDRGRECPVYPNRSPYQLALFSRNQTSEVEHIDGLGALTIFRLTSDLGPRVLGTEHLLAGGAYVAIHDDRLSIPAPPEAKLSQLSQRENWKAFIFRVPRIISEAFRIWARDVLSVTLQSSIPTSSILWPPTADLLSDGTWTVLDREPVIVGIQSTTGRCNQARLVHEDGYSPSEVPLSSSRSFIKLESLNIGYHELRTDSEAVPVIPILVTNTLPSARCESLTFEIADKNGTRLEALWSTALQSSFHEIVKKSAELRRINIPKRCPIVLKVFIRRKWNYSQFSGTNVVSEAQQLKAAVLQQLSIPDSRLEIDAGGFGILNYPPREPVPAQDLERFSTARSQWLDLAMATPGFCPNARAVDEDHEDLRAHFRQVRELAT